MEARTFLLWFQLDKARLDTPQQDDAQSQNKEDDVLRKVRELPAVFYPGKWTSALETRLDDGSILYISHTSDCHSTMRLYNSGLLTFDVQRLTGITAEKHGKNHILPNLKLIRSRLAKMKHHLGDYCVLAKCLDSPIYRGSQSLCPYVVTGDERILQRDFTELVHEADSRWQNIKIYNSMQCGHVLYLDDDVMLGESDLVYTETLLGLDRNDFTNKNVLILGGGDGGLLHELITRTKPMMVTMVEIDEEVITACRTHMRGVCGNILDKYQGSNYKIIIGDCLKFLKNALENNTTFDYIINDLTEFPVEKALYGFSYDFATSDIILELCSKLVSPSGKYLARGNTVSCSEYLAEMESCMKKLNMRFRKFVRFVPSFMEEYYFIEAWKEKPPS